VWDDVEQRERCLTSLLADGLVTEEQGLYQL
jgi:hypothetical protein